MEDPLTQQLVSSLRVLLCFDEPVCAVGLRAVIEEQDVALGVCQTETETAGMIRSAKQHQPHLIVYSLALDPDLTLLSELRNAVPQAAIVLWGRDFSVEATRHAISLGARAFLCSTAGAETIRECLRIAATGEMWMERTLSNMLLNSRPVQLSRRQSQLLSLLMQGFKNREIAASMGISEGTVKAYLTTLFEKVGARDRFELALFGLKNLPSSADGADVEREVRMKGSIRPRTARAARVVA